LGRGAGGIPAFRKNESRYNILTLG